MGWYYLNLEEVSKAKIAVYGETLDEAKKNYGEWFSSVNQDNTCMVRTVLDRNLRTGEEWVEIRLPVNGDIYVPIKDYKPAEGLIKFTFSTKEKAWEIVEKLRKLIEDNGYVSQWLYYNIAYKEDPKVSYAQLYNSYNNYDGNPVYKGWTNLNMVAVYYTDEGWVIDLPKPIDIARDSVMDKKPNKLPDRYYHLTISTINDEKRSDSCRHEKSFMYITKKEFKELIAKWSKHNNLTLIHYERNAGTMSDPSVVRIDAYIKQKPFIDEIGNEIKFTCDDFNI